MKTAELRAMDDARLQRMIKEAHQEMFNLRFQLATGKSVNTSRFTELRKDIARAQTVLRERQEA